MEQPLFEVYFEDSCKSLGVVQESMGSILSNLYSTVMKFFSSIWEIIVKYYRKAIDWIKKFFRENTRLKFSSSDNTSSSTSSNNSSSSKSSNFDEIKYDEIKYDEIKYDELKFDEIKLDEIKIDEFKLDEFKLDEFEIDEFKFDEFKLDEFKLDEFDLDGANHNIDDAFRNAISIATSKIKKIDDYIKDLRKDENNDIKIKELTREKRSIFLFIKYLNYLNTDIRVCIERDTALEIVETFKYQNSLTKDLAKLYGNITEAFCKAASEAEFISKYLPNETNPSNISDDDIVKVFTSGSYANQYTVIDENFSWIEAQKEASLHHALDLKPIKRIFVKEAYGEYINILNAIEKEINSLESINIKDYMSQLPNGMFENIKNDFRSDVLKKIFNKINRLVNTSKENNMKVFQSYMTAIKIVGNEMKEFVEIGIFDNYIDFKRAYIDKDGNINPKILKILR